jgi:hypothetical protein
MLYLLKIIKLINFLENFDYKLNYMINNYSLKFL